MPNFENERLSKQGVEIESGNRVEKFRGELEGLLRDVGEIEDLRHDLLTLELDNQRETRRGRAFTKASSEEIERSWAEDFTDPSQHNPEKFQYLVHGIQGIAARLQQMIFLLEGVIERGNSFDDTQYIDLLETPEKIGEKKVISCSVINQERRETFGGGGFILKTPPQNILRVSPEDVGTDFTNPDGVTVNAKDTQRCTVNELLQSSSPFYYNEVVTRGQSESGTVEIVGFWIKTYSDGDPVEQDVAHQIRILARRMNKPLVTIEERGADYQDAKPEILGALFPSEEPYGFALNQKGFRYIFDFKENRFFKYDSKYRPHELTAEEKADARDTILHELDKNIAGQYGKLVKKLKGIN